MGITSRARGTLHGVAGGKSANWVHTRTLLNVESRGKPLKIAIAVVVFVAAGAIAYWNTRSTSAFPTEWTFVCVASGKIFAIPNEGKVREFPLENPETKERTLFPCKKHEDGFYYVSSRWREGVKQLGSVNRSVDLETLRVKAAEP